TCDDRHERRISGGTAVSPEETPIEAARRKHVLVIDDDESLRQELAGLLSETGYEVEEASNGLGALRMLKDGPPPDVIVCDLNIPLLNGWELRTHLRKDPRLASIPLLAISADRSPKASCADADAFLLKPLSCAVLLQVVARLAATRKSPSPVG